MSLAQVWQRPKILVLESERVRLRPLALSDDAAMYLYASDPEVTKYLPWDPALNPESVRPFLSDQMRSWQAGTSYAFALVWKETNEMIGSTSLMGVAPWRWWNRSAELGYILRKDFWGRGVMTEAASLTLDFALHTLKLKRVYAWADAQNAASCRVLEKIGMQRFEREERIVSKDRCVYQGYEIFRKDALKDMLKKTK
jgi:[ribosomal protein S5]-alanine N-acetyltransferase